MASISLTWHTAMDDRVCPICRTLEGYIWTFDVTGEPMTGALVHPIHGLVWTLGMGSQAHGHSGNCRCHLTHEVNMQDLVEVARKLRDRLLQAYEEMQAAKKGG